MKIVIAIDSFKGSLSSLEAGRAAAAGIRRAIPAADTVISPLADGGEGTAEALVLGLGGQFREVSVSDPLGRPVNARYGILPGNTAVIEMAAASGLPLLSEEERDPMVTSTCGTGQLILDAVGQSCRELIIGIGGSATNDGGIGCLQALGFGFLDRNGSPVTGNAAGLAELCSITFDNAAPELKNCRFHVACDVDNPLCGERGCSAVFAPQKGADTAAVKTMDGCLQSYAELVKSYIPSADPDMPGAGAAGGMGFALRNFLGADISSGVSLVLHETGLEEELKSADFLVTGEGCLDSQTAMGKAPAGAAALAAKYGVPVIAFCGAVREGAELCNASGINAFFPILRRTCSISEAMDKENAAKNLTDTAEQVFRLINAVKN